MADYDPSKAYMAQGESRKIYNCTDCEYESSNRQDMRWHHQSHEANIRHQPALRDQFAIAGLAASMNHGGSDPVKWAENAYRIADAMLEARKPKPEPAPQRCPGCHQTTCRGDCMMNAMSR